MNTVTLTWHAYVPLVEFMYLVFTRMPGESYRWRLRSLLLYLCYVFRTLINSLVLILHLSYFTLLLLCSYVVKLLSYVVVFVCFRVFSFVFFFVLFFLFFAISILVWCIECCCVCHQGQICTKSWLVSRSLSLCNKVVSYLSWSHLSQFRFAFI